MGRRARAIPSPCDYETLRSARMLENQARLESLGLFKTVSELRQRAASAKPKRPPSQKRVYGLTPLRRSQRIKASDNNLSLPLPPRRSQRLRSTSTTSPLPPSKPEKEKIASSDGEEEEEVRPANAPLIKISVEELQISPEASSRRCNSKGRGSVYNSILGICCHFCRQKKLCGEEDCKRCGNFDVNEPCLGKTDCSVCHSSTGVFCRACLMVRYGEEIEEVRKNKEWKCPHCIEAKGISPYWICNSSICLKKRKIAPTGLAIYKEKEKIASSDGEEEEEVRPANAPLIKISVEELQISPEASSRRCNSKGRGSVYNSILGICCQFCRQKKLCGEEDCKRCGNFDVNEPCLGKTDCSVCHSSTGVFCRACLMVRYGEEIEEVRKNKEWKCPHCIEAKGINPYWICNSSICLKKRKIAPTGLAIYKARELGYKSVARLLMEELKRGK